MRCYLPLVALLLLGACAEREPDRLVIGVSNDRAGGSASAEADNDMRRALDAQARQICTHGYDPVKVSTLPAEDSQEIVTEDFRCRDYHLDFISDLDFD
jgi:hypothetical protein